MTETAGHDRESDPWRLAGALVDAGLGKDGQSPDAEFFGKQLIRLIALHGAEGVRALKNWLEREIEEGSSAGLEAFRAAHGGQAGVDAETRWAMQLTKEAREFIAQNVAEASARECSFLLSSDGDLWGHPRLLWRGRRDLVYVDRPGIPTDQPVAVVHNHPSNDIEPSRGDLESADSMVKSYPNCAVGIISCDGDRLYWIFQPWEKEEHDR